MHAAMHMLNIMITETQVNLQKNQILGERAEKTLRFPAKSGKPARNLTGSQLST